MQIEPDTLAAKFPEDTGTGLIGYLCIDMDREESLLAYWRKVPVHDRFPTWDIFQIKTEQHQSNMRQAQDGKDRLFVQKEWRSKDLG
ncbi:hypothetical protein [Tropicibacter sp. S64]|uniref:hypothetical protein n=1 Tax=Tropicibacter sp. S64 TaxID=3415122 RepID=UPI003C7C4A80